MKTERKMRKRRESWLTKKKIFRFLALELSARLALATGDIWNFIFWILSFPFIHDQQSL